MDWKKKIKRREKSVEAGKTRYWRHKRQDNAIYTATYSCVYKSVWRRVVGLSKSSRPADRGRRQTLYNPHKRKYICTGINNLKKQNQRGTFPRFVLSTIFRIRRVVCTIKVDCVYDLLHCVTRSLVVIYIYKVYNSTSVVYYVWRACLHCHLLYGDKDIYIPHTFGALTCLSLSSLCNFSSVNLCEDLE